VVQGQAEHPRPVEAQQLDLVGDRRDHVAEVLLVLEAVPRRRMLQDDAARLARQHQLRPARPRRVAQRRLPFEEDHVGGEVLVALHDRVLQFAADEVVRRAVEHEAVGDALQPTGLAGVHDRRLQARRSARLDEHVAGRALAERAIGAEHGDAAGLHLADGAGPEVQFAARPRPPHVDQLHAAAPAAAAISTSSARNSCRPHTTSMPSFDRHQDRRPHRLRQHAAGRGDADHEAVGAFGRGRAASPRDRRTSGCRAACRRAVRRRRGPHPRRSSSATTSNRLGPRTRPCAVLASAVLEEGDR
jgi:hypothetical protein